MSARLKHAARCPHTVKNALVKDEVDKRIKALQPVAAVTDLAGREGEPKEVIKADVEYTNELLNKWFHEKLSVPPLKLTEPTSMLSYSHF